MKIAIVRDTSKNVLAENIHTDLTTIELEDRTFEAIGRMHIGNGVWKVWNKDSEYLELKEVA